MANEDITDSRVVSRVLDWFGFSQDDIVFKQTMWRHREFLQNLTSTIRNSEEVYIYSGSRSEGVGSEITNSDMDVMISNRSIHAIFHTCEWEPCAADDVTVLVDSTDIHPGYARLKLMRNDTPEFITSSFCVNGQRVCVKHDGVALLPNYFLGEDPFVDYRQGPALTRRLGDVETDTVRCFSCRWPPVAEEWICRTRHPNWKSHEIAQSAIRIGAHVVPIGHKMSSKPEVEWRLSFSVIELKLMRSWPNHTMKCYVLLKLLKKDITLPIKDVATVLSSYHMKTLLFWLLENTGHQWWEEQPLMECLMFSLENLLKWIQSGCIRHYFIRDNNLFDAVSRSSRDHLLSAIRGLISEGPACLLRCRVYVERSREALTKIQTQGPSSGHVLHLKASLRIMAAKNIEDCLLDLIRYLRKPGLTPEKYNEAIQRLMFFRCSEKMMKESVEYILLCLRNNSGSHLISLLCRRVMPNRKKFALLSLAESMLTSSPTIALKLKFASCLLQIGRDARSLEIIEKVSEQMNGYLIRLGHTGSVAFTTDEQKMKLVSSRSNVDALVNVLATDVIFVPTEIHATPDVLKYEMFKLCEQPRNLLENILVQNRNTASVSSNVFMFYLQYLYFTRNNMEPCIKMALANLRWAVMAESDSGSKATGYNILGHCYMTCGKLDQAYDCFVKSLCLQPRFSAVLIHLAVLVGKAFKERHLLG